MTDDPRKVEDTDEVAIRRLHAEGLSQTRTAERLGLDRRNLGRWSKRVGLSWNVPPEPATTIAHERMRALRDQIAAQALSDASNLRVKFWEESVQLIVTRDGIERVILPEATPREASDIASAIEKLVRIADHHSEDAGVTGMRSMLTKLQAEIIAAVEAEEED